MKQVKRKSVTKEIEYFSPTEGQKPVRVGPSQRRIEQGQPSGFFAGLKRRKKPTGTERAEEFLDSQKR